MADRLADEDFDTLFSSFEHTAFRLETLPRYTVPEEADALARFLAGEPADLDWFQPWLNTIRTLTEQGKRVERVRIVDEPPTDYQRFELSIAPRNAAAGETIHYLHRATAEHYGLPVSDGDWWLFDSTRVVSMGFDPDGRPLDSLIFTDPVTVIHYNAWRDLAVHCALIEEKAA